MLSSQLISWLCLCKKKLCTRERGRYQEKSRPLNYPDTNIFIQTTRKVQNMDGCDAHETLKVVFDSTPMAFTTVFQTSQFLRRLRQMFRSYLFHIFALSIVPQPTKRENVRVSLKVCHQLQIPVENLTLTRDRCLFTPVAWQLSSLLQKCLPPGDFSNIWKCYKALNCCLDTILPESRVWHCHVLDFLFVFFLFVLGDLLSQATSGHFNGDVYFCVEVFHNIVLRFPVLDSCPWSVGCFRTVLDMDPIVSLFDPGNDDTEMLPETLPPEVRWQLILFFTVRFAHKLLVGNIVVVQCVCVWQEPWMLWHSTNLFQQ